MKARPILFSLALLTAVAAAPAAAQDMTGSWTISAEGRRGAQTMTLAIVQEGSELNGSIELTMGGRRGGGGGGGGAQSFAIEDGSIDGNEFTFAFTISFNGNSIKQTYVGTVDGDSMEGTISGPRGGGRPFTGERGS